VTLALISRRQKGNSAISTDAITRTTGAHRTQNQSMLIDLDQTTIANMTAALDYVCENIPADRDSNELRKRIADELIRCAHLGKRSVIDLQGAGMNVLAVTTNPIRLNWLGLRR